jgi:tRNA threonylcarbamoyladenosine modification (KEOPS) complex  Pcc1 subunit
MKAKTSIEVFFDSQKSAKSAHAALSGESGFSRARSSVVLKGKNLLISLDADDVVALRAAANGIMRNLQVFESIEENVE